MAGKYHVHHRHKHGKHRPLHRPGVAILAGTVRQVSGYSLLRRYLLIMLVPTMLIVVGTAGYLIIEKEATFLDALYMTVITLTTVGYGEIPGTLSPQGRIFT